MTNIPAYLNHFTLANQDIGFIGEARFRRAYTNSEGVDVQTGTFYINIFCRALPNGLPDTVHLKTVTEAVITVLEAYNNTSGTYFACDIVGENTMSDRDSKTMTYTSLTLNFAIES